MVQVDSDLLLAGTEHIHIDPPHLTVGPRVAEVDLLGAVTCGP
jgi:hypothetical protein